MTFDRALANLREQQLREDDPSSSLSIVIEEAVRMRRALKFYANPANYIDGVPMLKNADGLFVEDDSGHTARHGLRLNDYIGAPLIVVPQEEGKSNVEA